MPSKQRVAQMVITVLEDERMEWDEQYVRLMSQLNEAKRRGKVSKHRLLKRNDLAKLAFRLGMIQVKNMTYLELYEKLEATQGNNTRLVKR